MLLIRNKCTTVYNYGERQCFQGVEMYYIDVSDELMSILCLVMHYVCMP